VIQAANEAFLRETFMTREQLVGRPVLEVFASDGMPSATRGMTGLEASLGKVISTGQAHQMPVQSYNFPDPETPGVPVECYRSASNTPVLDENGEIMYIIHQATNATESVMAERRLRESHAREKEAVAKAQYHRRRMKKFLLELPAGICSFAGPDLVYDFVNPHY
jgi:hypothetical protein